MADNMFGTSERTDEVYKILILDYLCLTVCNNIIWKHGGEVEVDDITLKQLMAAGADIEIIEQYGTSR